MTRRTHGIRTLLTAASVGVAVLALALAALLTAPIVSGSVERTARESLARDVDLLARLPKIARLSESSRVPSQGLVRRGLALGILTTDGQSIGVAAVLTPAQRALVLTGNPVSGDGDLDGVPVLVEARPLSGGAGVVLGVRADVVQEAVTAQRRRLLLALAGGLVLALAVGAQVSGRLSRPLAAVAATARRLSNGERGIADHAADRGPREVSEVAAALHLLDGQLARSEERQRRFLLSVSHELRTPLTAIRGYAESMEDGGVSPEEIAAVGATMLAESLRLERYVADLLSLSRLEADDFDVNIEEVDVMRMLREGATAWAERAARAGMSVEVFATDVPLAHTDAGRVRQILDVLTDNAVRVCPPGSSVLWSARSESSAAGRSVIVISVADDGPGIATQDVDDAFAPGVLRDHYAASRRVGHGLGLAIAHRLADRLGATLSLGRSAAGGAEFRLTLRQAE